MNAMLLKRIHIVQETQAQKKISGQFSGTFTVQNSSKLIQRVQSVSS